MHITGSGHTARCVLWYPPQWCPCSGPHNTLGRPALVSNNMAAPQLRHHSIPFLGRIFLVFLSGPLVLLSACLDSLSVSGRM